MARSRILVSSALASAVLVGCASEGALMTDAATPPARDAGSGVAPRDGALPDAGDDAARDPGIDATVGVDAAIDPDAIAAPRPISPLSTALATTQRPRFRWQLAAGTDGAIVEVCATRVCATVIATIDALGETAAPTDALPTGTVFWRLRGRSGGVVGTQVSPTWQVRVPPRSAPVDTSWGSDTDLNGDGITDLLPPYIEYSPGPIEIYFGAAGGPASSPDVVIPRIAHADQFNAGTRAEDVNGDGYVDLLVGETSCPTGCPGTPTVATLSVYFGGLAGPSQTPDQRIAIPGLNLGNVPEGPNMNFAAAGDVNGDGYADIVVETTDASSGWVVSTGRPVLLGGPSGLVPTPAATLDPRRDPSNPYPNPSALVATGDLDGDGYADLVITNDRLVSGSHEGHLDVYYGGAAGLPVLPSLTLLRTDVWSTAVAPGTPTVTFAGDVDGDGFADLTYVDTSGYASIARILRGGPGGLAATRTCAFDGYPRTDRPDTFVSQASFTPLGDVDGDGFADVLGLTSNTLVSTAPPLLWYPGGAPCPGVGRPIPLDPTLTWVGALGIGDVDADGFGDAWVYRELPTSPSGYPSPSLVLGSATGLADSTARGFH